MSESSSESEGLVDFSGFVGDVFTASFGGEGFSSSFVSRVSRNKPIYMNCNFKSI